MFKYMKPLIISLAALSSSIISAECLNLDIILTNGYRKDKINTSVKTRDILTDSYASKHITLPPLEMYQLGGKAFYNVCGWDFRADGNFAWSQRNTGNFSETNQSNPSEFNFTGKLRSAKVIDFTFGTGYRICPFTCVTVIPMGGVSYQSLKTHVKNPLIDDSSDSILTNLEYKNRIKGTWVGYDIILEISCLKIRAGYEHHFSNWHGNRELRATKPSFSSSSSSRCLPSSSSSSSSSQSVDRDRDFFFSRRSKGARGNVIYADAHWNFCSGLTIGLGGKVQLWRISKGLLTRLKDSDILRNSPRKQNSLKWEIFAVTLNIGGHF